MKIKTIFGIGYFLKKIMLETFFLKAIWDGNLDLILSEKYSKFIRKKESI